MDIKDDILLRLQHSIKAKDSYIEYLQNLLKTHNIDFDEFDLISADKTQDKRRKSIKGIFTEDTSDNAQLYSQYSESSNNYQTVLSSEVAARAQIQKFEGSSQNSLSDITNTHKTGNYNNAVNPSVAHCDQSSEHNKQIHVYETDSFKTDDKFSSSTVLTSEIIHSRVYLPRITSDIINRFFSYFHGREDVYANRAGKPNPKSGKYGYYPKCLNFYKQGICLKTLKGIYNNQQNAGHEHHVNLRTQRSNSSGALSMYPVDNDYAFNGEVLLNGIKKTPSLLKQHPLKLSCSECKYRQFVPITPKAIYEHLMGMKTNCSDVIGI